MNGAGEIGNEDERALENADEDQVSVFVVLGDLGANFRDALLDFDVGDENAKLRIVHAEC
jgi:hypothetical protein